MNAQPAILSEVRTVNFESFSKVKEDHSIAVCVCFGLNFSIAEIGADAMLLPQQRSRNSLPSASGHDSTKPTKEDPAKAFIPDLEPIYGITTGDDNQEFLLFVQTVYELRSRTVTKCRLKHEGDLRGLRFGDWG